MVQERNGIGYKDQGVIHGYSTYGVRSERPKHEEKIDKGHNNK